MKKIAVMTTGGDAPGMNPAIRSVVRYGISQKLEVMGVFRGWWGLINEELKPLNRRSVSGIIGEGGTILKTARCPEFRAQEGQQRAYETIKKNNIDGLVVIGGNGSFAAAHEFYKKFNIPCIGVAASIDNDVNGIDYTIGTDTAINTALDAIDKIRDTATSMERIFVVEVMGRESGFIALTVALAGGCEDVIIPEKAMEMNVICHDIVHGNLVGKMSWIIVIAEGAGKADDIARQITEMTGLETRTVVLGHVQRGGRPTAASRDLALNLGKAAVDCLIAGKADMALGLTAGKIVEVDFKTAIRKKELKIDNFYKLIKILT
ncbi:MAG: 6-phosphofructokinase [Candidatus Omnitrophica bacterium]|nr:6-phosphofructokinase [Candidatus Omnitrophota bacterium]MBU4303126.1 6-phosphofructokinase [Candidatus Omnitrophota bacterium]MBU4418326.1 6-phosphofructokinase [Candidatus Omnitrophota bacterium]MBU4467811.1 6-phosphofructokinase [Candidatus Omnitrophota bacterium]MCG2708320.1 6-phosphofructokinase [Candidatus Omnitrophota bacterium]